MGYAKPGQDSHGIHTRLFSRAAIIEDMDGSRVCFVSADIGMISQIIKLEVKSLILYFVNNLFTLRQSLIDSFHNQMSSSVQFFRCLL